MRWLAVVVLGACSFHNNDLGAHDAPVIPSDDAAIDSHVDAEIDAAPDAPPDARQCFGAGLATVCVTQLPSGDHDVNDATTISTDTDCTEVVPQTSGPELCVIDGVNIHINNTLDATGSRPLVLLATNQLVVTGKIDVSSYRLQNGSMVVGEHVGAGEASGALCGAPSAGGDGGGGAGGGAGGTFGGRGGAGAAGRNGGGGTGGASAPVGGAPTFVRGGCSGTQGGNNGAGAPGHGGGAVYLIAGSSMTLSGVITASGEGGYGGAASAGGGGAGAGGLIGLDAPTISSSATIFANGGGGGEGGGQNDAGDPGSSALTATTAAPGGGININGGDGGRGSVGTTLDGENGHSDSNGGGAGGGGAGVIRVFGSSNLGGVVSPPAS